MDVSVTIAVQLFDVLNIAYMTQKFYPASRIRFETIDEAAAIIRVSGNCQQTLCWRFLETFHDQRRIVLRNQPAANQIIIARLQAILPDDTRVFGALDVSAIGDESRRRLEFLEVQLPHGISIRNNAAGNHFSA